MLGPVTAPPDGFTLKGSHVAMLGAAQPRRDALQRALYSTKQRTLHGAIARSGAVVEEEELDLEVRR
jgi:hypothetical protein